VGTGAGALTIGNGTLGTATAGGDLALVNTTASGFTINSVIANNTAASTLSKLGTGLVTLTNANTYTGATTISAGTLQLGAGGTTGSLDTTGAIVLANSGNLTINRSNAVTQGTDFSGAAITGTGSFTQAGTGTTTLNALNTYSGPTTITAGILNANSTDALGSCIAGNTLVFIGGSLQAVVTITSLTVLHALLCWSLLTLSKFECKLALSMHSASNRASSARGDGYLAVDFLFQRQAAEGMAAQSEAFVAQGAELYTPA
jgi:autotransporter-associated beta strand protein